MAAAQVTAPKLSAYREHVVRTIYRSLAKPEMASSIAKKFGVTVSTPNIGEEAFFSSVASSALKLTLLEFETTVRASMSALASVTPQVYLRFDLNEVMIASLTDELIAWSKRVHDEVAAVEDGMHSFENTVGKLASEERLMSVLSTNAEFMQHVHSEKSIRDAACEADKKLSAHSVECGMRLDVFESLSKYAEKGDTLLGEDKRLLDFLLRDFRRNGLMLPDEKRSKIKALQQRMSELSITFAKNLGEENTLLEFSEVDLEGLPADFIEKLPNAQSGKYHLSLRYPEAFPVLKLAKREKTRKEVEYAFNRRCIDENTPILDELVSLRAEHAKLLEYPSHAAYRLETRMAKSPQEVMGFLKTLSQRLDKLARMDMDSLKHLKKEECGRDADKIYMWDFRYYLNQREEKEYLVDHEEIKKYFPLQTVLDGCFKIYETLFAVTFEIVRNATVWHKDVKMYSVLEGKTGDLVGYFYIDLHPREGKYGHAACFGLQAQCGRGMNRQYPAAAMVANFTKPSATKPSLLRHEEVVTLFHELGHVLHQLFSDVEYVHFAGTRVERDFVEAPSQLLENWCYEEEPLKIMSGHFETGETLPKDLLNRLVAARHANAGLLYKRQVLFAIFDQILHSTACTDSTELLYKLQEDIMSIPATKGTNFAASFGHIAGGYDAQYYGYLWSQVFSCDMFRRFKQNGILDPAIGTEYRSKVIGRGGSIDAVDMLVDFLGRDPSQDAFLEELGLN